MFSSLQETELLLRNGNCTYPDDAPKRRIRPILKKRKSRGPHQGALAEIADSRSLAQFLAPELTIIG
jgi:hypothetical protein